MRDVLLTLTGAGIGFLVGLTGIGGGALMTPVLVVLFRVDPLTAISSDLVASLMMKPVGSAVHLRHGSVHRGIAVWLAVGSIPAAFGAAITLDLLAEGRDVDASMKVLLGAALLVAAMCVIARPLLPSVARRGPVGTDAHSSVRRAATVSVGVIGGVLVGLTSVGSGSLIIVAMMLLYPALSPRTLVGTDLVQAIPLVGAATLGHMLFGHVELALSLALVVGSLPGCYLGARVSARHSTSLLRPVLVVVLLLTAAKLLGAPPVMLLVLAVVLASLAVPWQRLSQRRTTVLEPQAVS